MLAVCAAVTGKLLLAAGYRAPDSRRGSDVGRLTLKRLALTMISNRSCNSPPSMALYNHDNASILKFFKNFAVGL